MIEPGKGAAAQHHTPRILVVDDEPHLRESLVQIMQLRGYHVESARNGAEALQVLQREPFDLVLLDLVMPELTGHQVMDRIHALKLDLKVIVVSGDTSIDSAISAIRHGAYDFVRKPYEPEEMLKRVANALSARKLEVENHAITERLHQSESWYRYLVNNSPDLIYTLDREGLFTYINDAAEKILGYGKNELLGKHYSTVIHDDDINDAVYAFNERRTGDRSTRDVELRLKCKNGVDKSRNFENRFVTIELNSMGMYDSETAGSPARFVGTYGIAKDITDRKEAEQTISYQAYHDLLTGLPNRALFKDRLGQAMSQAKRNSTTLAVMFLDMDRFKFVNDTLGHVAGDELLQLLSTRLKSCLREGDTLARVGGDEFILLLPQITSRQDAVTIAQKILAALNSCFMIDEHELFASVSIGIALYPSDGETSDTLIKHADIAMYHAKNMGRNNYQLYAGTMNAPISGRLSLESDIRKAIERNEFEVHYQPQVSVASGQIIGMEALVRWKHPLRGLLPPSDFIPFAEETGLICAIGEWVLQTVCRDARAWQAAGLPPVRMAINLSAQQIEQNHFVEKFTKLIEECNVDPSLLELEITESTIMKDMENTISKLKRLSLTGVEISIDDFGTGYSSLSYLKKLPIHTLKVDQSFVRDIISDPSGTSIVTAIAAMAKGLQLHLVAEGVETRAQLDFLAEIGCDEYQGFLFSEPLPAKQAASLLARKHASVVH
jgi:diguanylate cyclase (GGDEF)-like protein/PAS domain S-box-containing protein